jgi:hypothetical protein
MLYCEKLGSQSFRQQEIISADTCVLVHQMTSTADCWLVQKAVWHRATRPIAESNPRLDLFT